MRYLLCEVTEIYDHAYERSVYRVSKPLQLFTTKDEADRALELFAPFYDYNLRVVTDRELDTDKEFR